MEILIIFLLILLNGMFAMSEIAMVSIKKGRLERLAQRGDVTAQKALDLAKNPSKFLSTVQIGITLIGILTGIYSGEKITGDLQAYFSQFQLLEPYSKMLSIGVIVIILTFFSLVLGELVPKQLGLIMPETISRVLAYPMYWISVIAAPFIWLLTVTTEFIINVFKIRQSSEGQVTEEEIKAIIQEGTDTGVVQEIEQGIMENVFHLGDRKVKSLMTQRFDVAWIDINLSIPELKELIANSPYKSFPVCDKQLDNVLGILHSKEMLNALLKENIFNIKGVLKPAMFLSENSTAYKALEKFQKMKDHMSVIVDEFGTVQGILTMNDLVEALVVDFTTQMHEKQEIIPRDNNSFLVDGSVSLLEFARYFDIELTKDDAVSRADTVSGIILHFVKGIPDTGFKIEWKNLTLEVIDMDGRRIDKILVTKNIP
ncbi:hemolysin family protein [Solitalea lacus]|uniref:hemolysin family protein n=1 Tax=Solitalea lacus TaxID=2911172 RepID=UPI001EDC755B|nr:hemolysin family protein [Solitalea lacus]UKJ09148.1 hemolysin family protein [Solitalea lacus]